MSGGEEICPYAGIPAAVCSCWRHGPGAIDPDRNCGDPYSGIGCADPDCTHRPANWPAEDQP